MTIDWHDWSYIAQVLFRGIGLMALICGGYSKNRKVQGIGTALMLYDFIVPKGILEWLVGTVLVVCLYIFRKKDDSLMG